MIRRTLLATAMLVCMAAFAAGQDGRVPDTAHGEANEFFFGPLMALLLIVPLGLTVILAIKRKQTRGSVLPTFDDATFEAEVLESQMPVLVHFSAAWSVANRAALSQTELLQWQNRGAVLVGLLDVTEAPRVMARFPGLEAPAYLLFYRGRKLFHRPGLRQADEIQEEIDKALAREGF